MVNESKVMSNRFNRSPHVTFSTNLTSTAVALSSSKNNNTFANNVHLSVVNQKLLCQASQNIPLLDKSSLSKCNLAIENGNNAFRGKSRLSECEYWIICIITQFDLIIICI